MSKLQDTKELNKYILLIKKHSVDNTKYEQVMIAGLEAMIGSVKHNIDIDHVKNQLYKYLDNPKPGLDDYIEISKVLETINSPLTANDIQYVIAGIDSLNNSEEFLDTLQENKLDFLLLFKIFAKFMTEAAELSSSNDNDIDAKYPGLSYGIEYTGADGKKISKKYKFLAKFLKLLVEILLMNRYMIQAIADASKVLNNHLKAAYRTTINTLKALQCSVKNNMSDIQKSMRGLSNQANKVLIHEYNQLLENLRELQRLYDKLEHQIKIAIVANALNNDHRVFDPLLDPKNRDVFAKIALNIKLDAKQDQFTGLTGILNTRPDLRLIRNTMQDIMHNISDALIIAVFVTSVAIARELQNRAEQRSEKFSDNSSSFIRDELNAIPV